MNYKKISLIKFFLLFLALCLASFLAFGDTAQEATPDQQIVFILDVSKTMDIQDVASGTQVVSRLDAAKHILQTTIFSEPHYSYGLILLAGDADYIIPPTFDTGTFLLYLSGVTTHLLPDGVPKLSSLRDMIMTGMLNTSYVLLSDFASVPFTQKILPSGTLLLGIGAAPYLQQSATFLHLPSFFLSHVDGFLLQDHIATSFSLPMAQRIVLYIVLGILVVLSIFV